MASWIGMAVPVFLLIVSNTFMTFAWYGHLKFPHAALWAAIAVSWLIALPEYLLAVPANRMGAQYFTLAELKTIQEVVTLIVFTVIAVVFFNQSLTWHHGIGFILIATGAAFIFHAGKAVS